MNCRYSSFAAFLLLLLVWFLHSQFLLRAAQRSSQSLGGGKVVFGRLRPGARAKPTLATGSVTTGSVTTGSATTGSVTTTTTGSTSAELLPIDNAHPSDGLANPNGLPKLPRIGPASFYPLLAPPYYGKSPVDGSRDYRPGSALHAAHCDFPQQPWTAADEAALAPEVAAHVKAAGARVLPARQELCSAGPDATLPFDTGRPSTYEFFNVCATHNLDSAKQVQRALVYFDPRNLAAARCEACPNPVMHFRWGRHACGIMWTHQTNARSLHDLQTCYERSREGIAARGQRQAPLHAAAARPLVGVWYPGRTLLLSFASSNPGQCVVAARSPAAADGLIESPMRSQVFDGLASLLPAVLARGALDRVVAHQDPSCPDSEWICAVLRRLGMLGSLVPVFDSAVTCFERLLVPRYGLLRGGGRGADKEHGLPLSAHSLQRLQRAIHAAFGLEPGGGAEGGPRPGALLYAHATRSKEAKKFRRTWRGMNETAAQLRAEGFGVRVVDDFAALAVAEQARAVFAADALVAMPHGGQFGNAVFARPGAVLVEMSCTGYTHIGLEAGFIPRALGLIHVVLRPCDCDGPGLDASFAFASALRVWHAHRLKAPGTWVLPECVA
jgi:hypothetical protein